MHGKRKVSRRDKFRKMSHARAEETGKHSSVPSKILDLENQVKDPAIIRRESNHMASNIHSESQGQVVNRVEEQAWVNGALFNFILNSVLTMKEDITNPSQEKTENSIKLLTEIERRMKEAKHPPKSLHVHVDYSSSRKYIADILAEPEEYVCSGIPSKVGRRSRIDDEKKNMEERTVSFGCPNEYIEKGINPPHPQWLLKKEEFSLQPYCDWS